MSKGTEKELRRLQL